MLVVDASAMVEVLLRSAVGRRLQETLRNAGVAAPAHLDAEVLGALARLVRAGVLAPETVDGQLRQLARAPILRFPVAPLLGEAWGLRDNVAMRDALYVVLARQLGASLLTTDQRLARAPGHEVTVIVAR